MPGTPDVSIEVDRVQLYRDGVVGVGSVFNNRTHDASTFYTLENARAGHHQDKPPIPRGDYYAHIRNHRGQERIELENNIPGAGGVSYSNIQIHPGNFPSNAIGCTLPGENVGEGIDNTRHGIYRGKPEPEVLSSRGAFRDMMEVVKGYDLPAEPGGKALSARNITISAEYRQEPDPFLARAIGLEPNGNLAQITNIRDTFAQKGVCVTPESTSSAACSPIGQGVTERIR